MGKLGRGDAEEGARTVIVGGLVNGLEGCFLAPVETDTEFDLGDRA